MKKSIMIFGFLLIITTFEVNAQSNRELIEAIANKNLEEVQSAINRGVSINLNYMKFTPLMYASYFGALEIVDLLIKNGAEVNAKSETGTIALNLSLETKNFEVAKYLIEKNSDVNFKDSRGQTPLMYASDYGQVDLLKLLLEKGAVVNETNKDGSGPLVFAAQNGHLEIVKVLLEKGANVDIKTNIGNTALMQASSYGHLDIVNLLLEKGADVNAKDDKGYTPLLLASISTDSIPDLIKLLINKNADINAKNFKGMNALMLAAKNGNIKNAELLISKGVEINAASIDGSTALHFASQKDYSDLVQLLVQNGADVDAKRNDGKTPLMFLSENGNLEMVKLLIEKGSNINILPKNNLSALVFAMSMNQMDIAKYLLNLDNNRELIVGDDNLQKRNIWSKQVISTLIEGSDLEASNILEAEEKYKMALKTAKKLGNISPEFVFCQNKLSKVYAELKDYKKAIKTRQAAVEIEKSIYELLSLQVANSFCFIVESWFASKQNIPLLETDSLLDNAQDIQEKILGKDHILLCNTLLLQVECSLYAIDYIKPVRPVSIFDPSQLAAYDNVYVSAATGSKLSKSAIDNRIEVVKKVGSHADSLCQRIIRIQEKHLGADHPQIAKTLRLYAKVIENSYPDAAQTSKAIELRRRADRIKLP